MNDDILKVLALLFFGVVGYFWAWRKHARENENVLLRNVIEEQNEKRKIEETLRATPIDELIRHANERLRKKRGDDL